MARLCTTSKPHGVHAARGSDHGRVAAIETVVRGAIDRASRAPKPYNPAKTDYLTQRGASIAHQHPRSSEYVFAAGDGPRARNVHNRAVSHTSHTATRPLGRVRPAAGLTRRHSSATIPKIAWINFLHT